MNAKVVATIERLGRGEIIENYRESGNSMTPLIHHQEPVTLEPVDPALLERHDMVFCKVRGRYYTHKVLALRPGEAQIGNNHGGVNGWTPWANVYGIVTAVNGRPVSGARAKVRTGGAPAACRDTGLPA